MFNSGKKKIVFNDSELKLLFLALNDFRNEMIKENRYTDAIDDIMAKLKNKTKVDKYDVGIIMNVLHTKLKIMLEKQEDVKLIQELLYRMIDIHEEIAKK